MKKTIYDLVLNDGSLKEQIKIAANVLNQYNYSKEDIAWLGFNYNLHFRNHFFNDNDHVFYFIKELFDNFTITLNQTDLLFRARRIKYNENQNMDVDNDFYGLSKKESFIPLVSDTVAGRANTVGIPCLYTAKEIETAIAEMRPYKWSKISIATIKLKRDIKLFDLFFDPSLHYSEIIGKYPNSKFWFNIASKFSIPYEDTSKNEYLITQCISEYLRLEGFDGIQYASSLNSGGKNIAVFNCRHEDDGGDYEICEPISSRIYTVEKIKYEFTNE